MKDNTVTVAGSNIYKNIYGESVYYNFIDKNGYVVTPQIESKFRVLYHRYAIICIVMILLGDYFNTFQNTLMVGVAALVIVETYFRLFFLKKMKVIKEFKRDKKVSRIQSIINSKEREKAIMKGVAYILVSILVVVNSLQQQFNTVFIVLSCVVSAGCLYSGVINIVASTKMRAKRV